MSLKIIVCVKQVPDMEKIRFFYDNGIVVENLYNVLNKDDASALEESLRIKDTQKDTHITIVTMGPGESKDAVLECLALGADDGVVITDEALADSDTLVTAEVLSAAIRKIGDYNVIFTGRQTIDGGSSQVGPQLAELLNLPQLTNIVSLNVEDDGNSIIAKRALENTCETVFLQMPCLLTVSNEFTKPRGMSLKGIRDAGKKVVKVWTADDLGLKINFSGYGCSPTRVKQIFMPTHKKRGRLICTEDEEEAVHELLKELKGSRVNYEI
ncbi:electron transfer flavoprotein subunit beta/FixA family protein [Sedimentibacter saalensis]|uniref:electron transfer flavoprotein subunit beta/FixA family protein n=1 Tax=Sedimentibacter saalensis TaxID=130788 RepID=UPI00289F6F5B|nr:electron transfer flavoprotein subunit beta/FixA family protein [Sedimentibacter saalensis]